MKWICLSSFLNSWLQVLFYIITIVTDTIYWPIQQMVFIARNWVSCYTTRTLYNPCHLDQSHAATVLLAWVFLRVLRFHFDERMYIHFWRISWRIKAGNLKKQQHYIIPVLVFAFICARSLSVLDAAPQLCRVYSVWYRYTISLPLGGVVNNFIEQRTTTLLHQDTIHLKKLQNECLHPL